VDKRRRRIGHPPKTKTKKTTKKQTRKKTKKKNKKNGEASNDFGFVNEKGEYELYCSSKSREEKVDGDSRAEGIREKKT